MNRARLAGTVKKSSDSTRTNWRKRNRIKSRAHSAAARAQKNGILKKPENCERCGQKGRLHKHHPDYSRPLHVLWLCPKCHGQAHWKDQPVLTDL
jgi:transposase-like protein